MQDVKQLRQPVPPVPLHPAEHIQHRIEPLHTACDVEQVRHLVLAAPEGLLELIVQNDMQVRRQRLRIEPGGNAVDLNFFGDHVVAYGDSRLPQKIAQQRQCQNRALVLFFFLRIVCRRNAPLYPALHGGAQFLQGYARLPIGLNF